MKKILSAGLILCLVSCKKEDKKSNEPTKENLAGSYKQTSETLNGMNSWNTTFHQACEMDNITQLKTNNTYSATDAGATCNPPDNFDGTWSVSGKTFTMDGIDLNIESFDGRTLILKETNTWGGGSSSVIISTYVKQ